MSTDNKLFLWMTLAMLGWGASWVVAKVLAGYIDENELVTYRYFITIVTMLPVLYYLKLSFKISPKSIVISIISAVFLILYTKLFFLGVKYGTAGLGAAVVTVLMPILVYILMIFSKNKKTVIKDWLALFLGAVGVLTMLNAWNFKLDDVFTTANIYLLLAALSWALMSIVTTFEKNLNPTVFSFYIYLFTTIIDYLLFFTPTNGSIFVMDWVFWLNLIILSVVSTTFATTMYFIGLQKLGSKKGSVFTFLVPFFAIGLSVVFLDEVLQLNIIIGVIITIVALIILNRIKFDFSNIRSKKWT